MLGILFLLGLGIAAMVLSIIPSMGDKTLKNTGVKTEGVIHKYTTGDDLAIVSFLLSFIKTRAVVQYTAQDMTWVSARIEENVPPFLDDNLKVGKTVVVYYDPKDPQRVFVEFEKSNNEGRILFFLLGLIVASFAFYFLQQMDF